LSKIFEESSEKPLLLSCRDCWILRNLYAERKIQTSFSLALGEYEDLKEAALDPYIALKDAFHQYRQNKIKEK